MEELRLPAAFPIRFSVDASQHLASPDRKKLAVRQELKGISQGTALAILLNEFGLGVYPLRLPDGTIELTIDPLDKVAKTWPAGWDSKAARHLTAPKLFEIAPISFEGDKLLDVIDNVSRRTGVPAYFDYHRIDTRGLDLSAAQVNYPGRKVSWSLFLRQVAGREKLTYELRIDENGKPFVWFSTILPPRRKSE